MEVKLIGHRWFSPSKKSLFTTYYLERALQKGQVIDNYLLQQILEQNRIWRLVLERIVTIIQTLAQQNLALKVTENRLQMMTIVDQRTFSLS